MTPPQTGEPLRVLILEDSETDTELIVRDLRKHGFDPVWTRVETEAAFLAQLEQPFDLITADATMPSFSAHRALALLHERRLGIPCIVVSGSIGEEEAVALIRAGASDYLMKDRLGRFGQAIRHVIEQRRLREEHRAANKALQSLNDTLERRITERTAELQHLNAALESELAERTRMEALLRRNEAELERRVEARTAQLERSHERLRRLASQLTLVEQRERKRLASELHDYLAQLLVVTHLKISHLKRLDAGTEAPVIIRDMETMMNQALTYVRTLVAELSPTVLFQHGLIPALQWLGSQMKLHGLEVEVQSDIETPPVPEDHAVLLFQSVRELLFNTVKHSGTGQAVVKAWLEDGSRLTILVSDEGRGFDPTRMWESPSGFGLLSIKERLEVMGGHFSVTSASGSGTRSTLSVPVRHSPPEFIPRRKESAPAPARSGGGPLRIRRVLVVDDHPMIRQQVMDLLKEYARITVVGESAHGEEAIAMTESLRPDVILMDINMPVLDGIEATKRILASRPETLIIGLSVHRDQIMHDMMRSAGAVASLTKERLDTELYPTIRRILHLSS